MVSTSDSLRNTHLSEMQESLKGYIELRSLLPMKRCNEKKNELTINYQMFLASLLVV